MYKILGPYLPCSLSKFIVNVQNPPSQYTRPMHQNWLILWYVVRDNIYKLCAKFQSDPPRLESGNFRIFSSAPPPSSSTTSMHPNHSILWYNGRPGYPSTFHHFRPNPRCSRFQVHFISFFGMPWWLHTYKWSDWAAFGHIVSTIYDHTMYKILGPYLVCSLSKLIFNIQNPPSQYTRPMHRNWLIL